MNTDKSYRSRRAPKSPAASASASTADPRTDGADTSVADASAPASPEPRRGKSAASSADAPRTRVAHAEGKSRPAAGDDHARRPSPARSRRRSSPWFGKFDPFRANFPSRRDLLAPVIGVAAALIIAIALSLVGMGNGGKTALSSIDSGDLISDSPIRISEVMSANSGSYSAPDGEFYDWIELQNISSETRSLKGLMLADELTSGKLYPLPDIALAPGECAIVYASDKGVSESGQVMHAGFKLSSAGDKLYLLTDAHELWDYAEIPALDADMSYACDLDSGTWSITSYITPGVDNSAFYAAPVLSVDVDSPIYISEAQPSNSGTLRDADGDYSDWIEICNGGSEAVDLTGWGLSDSTSRPLKWTFSNTTLQPGEYLLVYASGKNRSEGELHTGFCLSSDGGTVLLANAQGNAVSVLAYPEARADASYAPSADGTVELLTPTPGSANTSENMSAAQLARMAANGTGLFIEEVLCSNSVKSEPNTAGHDYIEIRNRSGETIDLGGIGLSDNPKNPRKWQFPDGATLGAGQRLVVYCSGNGSSDAASGYYETNFRLSSAGCTVTLALPDGTIFDECAMGQQYSDVSYGRTGDDLFAYLKNPTPGADNDISGYAGKLNDVEMSVSGGLMDSAFTLELISPEGATIYYTTDAGTPTESSTLYTGPIEISSTTIVRAAAFMDGYLPSYTATQSYFFGLSHKLPVVSLVSDDKYLFDWETGLLVMGPNAFEEEPYGRNGEGANFWMGWEYPANVEYFDADGTSQASERIGIKIIGQDSRAQEQKGIAMYARARYGNTALNFNPFEQLDFESYRALTLRPSGEDAQYTHLRDATLTSLAEGTNTMYQAAAPCVLYINGQCWGVYNLRERINKHYVAQHEGITDSATIDNIDLLKGDSNVLNGSREDYEELMEFVEDNSLEDEDNLKYVTDRIDLDNYIDYVLCEILVGNTDSGNIKYYQSPESGVKWKWIFFDLDWAMYSMDIDYFERYLNSEGHGVRRMFDNSLIRALLENDSVRERFLRRMAELMQGNFSTQHILDTIEAYKAEIYDDMQYQFAKWGSSYERWEKYLGRFEDNVRVYASNALSGVKEYFDLSDAEMNEYFGKIEFD